MLPEEEDAQNNNDNVLQGQYQEHVAALNAIAQAEESFLDTIGHLNRENKKLEEKINEADAQNNLLQMQLKVLMSKMENLESFMVTLSSLDEDSKDQFDPNNGENGNSLRKETNCPRCGFNLRKDPVLRRSESLEREIYGDNFNRSRLKSNSDIKNPMLIDLVVAKIMAQLPPRALFKCRQVSHLWNSEASHELRRKHIFKLNFDNIDQITKYTESPTSSECLFARLKLDVGFVINPFRNYLQEFFEIYGRSMIQLSINCEEEFANRIYTEELRNIFLAYLENIERIDLSLPTKITEKQSIYEDVRPRNRFVFQNLKTLSFNQFDNSGGYSVWFTKEMIKMAPNLRTIRVETHTKEVITRILLALGDRECRTICSQIKHIYLDSFVTQQHLEMLSQFDFQLKSLQLSYFTVEVTKEMVEAFLNRHRTTLETLILGDYQKRPSQASLPLTLRLPVMTNLRKITFIDPCFPDHRNLVLSPLSFSAQLPKLTSMAFEHETGKPSGIHLFTDLFCSSPTPCVTLEELKISHGLTDPTLIPQAAKMFPNLQRLDVANMPDAVLREVWMSFYEIVDLRLELCPVNVNVDSMLTGIPYEVCKKIQERNLYNQVEALDVLDIIRTEPSICNLFKLRTLKIDGLPSTLLTAVSGYLAISQLKTLTSVSIKSDVATLSRECRRVLNERLRLTLFELF